MRTRAAASLLVPAYQAVLSLALRRQSLSPFPPPAPPPPPPPRPSPPLAPSESKDFAAAFDAALQRYDGLRPHSNARPSGTGTPQICGLSPLLASLFVPPSGAPTHDSVAPMSVDAQGMSRDAPPARSSPGMPSSRYFPQQLMPNVTSARLPHTKPRGDDLFGPVLRRYEAYRERDRTDLRQRSKSTPTALRDGRTWHSGRASAPLRLHPLLQGERNPLQGTLVAARLLTALLMEAAAGSATASAQGQKETLEKRGPEFSERQSAGPPGEGARSPKNFVRPPSPRERHCLQSPRFVQALFESVFLSALFAVDDARDVDGRMDDYAGGHASSDAGESFPALSCLRGSDPGDPWPQLTSVLQQALEVCVAALLLASPFSFHLAFEYLVRQGPFAASPVVPLELFRLWCLVNPDQVTVELDPTAAGTVVSESLLCMQGRLLPTSLTRDVLDHGAADVTQDDARRRRVRYQRAVWRHFKCVDDGLRGKRPARETSCPPSLTRKSLLLDASYAAALHASVHQELCSGVAKYNLTSPLLSRVIEVGMALYARKMWSRRSDGRSSGSARLRQVELPVVDSVSTGGQTSEEIADWALQQVRSLFLEWIAPPLRHCAAAAAVAATSTNAGGGLAGLTVPSASPHRIAAHHALSPSSFCEYENWFTFVSLIMAVGMLEGAAGALRAAPRKRSSAAFRPHPPAAPPLEGSTLAEENYSLSATARPPTEAELTYDQCMSDVRARHAALVKELHAQALAVPQGNGRLSAEGAVPRNVDEWARLVFTTISVSFEFAGVFSPSPAHRPLVLAELWRQVHHRAVCTFPHVFSAGSHAVGTLLTLAALEGSLRRATGVGRLTNRSVGRETALLRWGAAARAETRIASRCGFVADEHPKQFSKERDGKDARGSRCRTDASLYTAHEARAFAASKRSKFLLARVVSQTGVNEDADPTMDSRALPVVPRAEERGSVVANDVNGHDRRRPPYSLPRVNYAERDLEYPPHTFVLNVMGLPSQVAEATRLALLEARRAAIAVAREHVQLPLLISSEAAANGTSDSLASFDGRPSFWVVMRLLQVLGSVGDTAEGDTDQLTWTSEDVADVSGRAAPVNAAAECIAKDFVPIVHPALAGSLSRLAVQSLTHSEAAVGAVPLLTTCGSLLDELSPRAAWESASIALMWSGLPASSAKTILEEKKVAHGPQAADATDSTACASNTFGAGSLAWSYMEAYLDSTLAKTVAEPTPPRSEASPTMEREEASSHGAPEGTSPLSVRQARAQLKQTAVLALRHLLALAEQLPQDTQRPVSLFSTLLNVASVHQSWRRGVQQVERGGSAETETTTVRAEETAGSVADTVYATGQRDGSDSYLEEFPSVVHDTSSFELDADGAVENEDGDIADAFTASTESEFDPSSLERDGRPSGQPSLRESIALPAAMRQADNGAKDANDTAARVTEDLRAARRDLQRLTAASGAASARHLFLSFLELSGHLSCACTPSPPASPSEGPHSLLRSPLLEESTRRLLAVGVGYTSLVQYLGAAAEASGARFTTAATEALTPPAVLEKASLTWVQDALQQHHTATGLALLCLSTVPDVALLASLVWWSVRTTQAPPLSKDRSKPRSGSLLTSRRVLAALCRMLYHSGATTITVRQWRQLRGLGSAPSGDALRWLHHSIFRENLCTAGSPSSSTDAGLCVKASTRELTMLLGSLTLEALQTSPPAIGAPQPDDFYVRAFLGTASGAATSQSASAETTTLEEHAEPADRRSRTDPLLSVIRPHPSGKGQRGHGGLSAFARAPQSDALDAALLSLSQQITEEDAGSLAPLFTRRS